MNIRSDFPIFSKKGKKFVYLDSAATALKSSAVINSVVNFYTGFTANVHRGLYTNAVLADKMFDQSRKRVARFLNVSEKEIIFVMNTTEAINLVAYSFGLQNIKPDDEIVVSVMEHHSNLVPWQMVASKTGAKLKYIDITDAGYLDLAKLKKVVNKKTKLIAVTHVSNVLGTINPIEKIVEVSRQINPKVVILVDGAQAVPHIKVDIQKLGCDFYAFSAHKIGGPSGIGVLWGRRNFFEGMQPFITGGGMVESVSLQKSVFTKSPLKFEAGTPNIEGVIGLGSAVDYLDSIGFENIRAHEQKLTAHALKQLLKISNLEIYGPLDIGDRSGVIAFNLRGIHPHDLAQILADRGIAIRSGHHCAEPLHYRLGIQSSARASFYIYNTKEDVDSFILAIIEAVKILKR